MSRVKEHPLSEAGKIDALLSDYAAYHQTKGNKICHFIGIPLIIYGLLALLQLVPAGPITGAEILIIAAVLYYLMLDIRLAAGMLLSTAALDAIARISDPRIGAAALIIGWIFQAIGHAVYERNRPAFFRNLVHLLVGPLFLLNEILHIRPVVIRPA
jgi:uncharacterized membrane protein YGL010W